MLRAKKSRLLRLSAGVIAVAATVTIMAGSVFAMDDNMDSNNVTLTTAEKEYIQENPTVSIAIDTSWLPYGFAEKDGSCAGVIPNVMNMVAQRTGLNVDFIAEDTYIDAIKSCKSGNTMLVSGIANDHEMADKFDLNITDPYITIGYTAVTKNKISDLYKKGADYRVALCVGTYAKTAMQKRMDSYTFLEYSSNRECLDAVVKNEADIALVANYSAGYYSSWHEFSDLQQIQINDFTWKLCFGVNKECDPMLIEILNKGINSIDENDLNQAIYSGATDASTSTQRLSDTLSNQPALIAIVTSITVAVITVIIFLFIFQKKKNENLIKEKNRIQLEESVEIIDAALHSAEVMVWSYDMNAHRITPKAASLSQHRFGESVENVPESLIENGYVHQDFVKAFRQLFESLKNADKPVQGDFLVQNADGSGYLWERIILAPKLNDGKTEAAIGTSINISVWKEKESNYRQLVSNMTNIDDESLIAKGRYNLTKNAMMYYKRKANNSLELSDGITFDGAVSAMLETAVNDNDREKLRAILDRKKLLLDFTEGRHDGSFEYRRVQDNDSHFWSLLKYSMFEEPASGNVIFFVYTYDITEHIREQQMLAKLGSTEYDVLGLIDVKTHHFESKSVRGVKSLADSGNHFIRGNFEDIIHQQIVSTVRESEKEELEKQLKLDYVIKKLEESEVYSIAFSAIRHNHTNRRKQLHFAYLSDTKTTIFYYCTDITEIYDREQEQLHKTEDALEEAKHASEAKTEFFSRMSHDMRTPMNGILGMVNLSEGENDVYVLRQNMEKIKSSGQYLLGLINDTLDFQKIESGKLVLQPEVIYTEDLLNSISEMISTTAKNKGVNFRISENNIETDWYIRTDPLRMKQIFVNLLSNAVKFTPSGGTVEIKFELIKREGLISHDRITVTDTGVGMSKEFMETQLFKPFAQEHNTVSSQYAGTGLGLSIAKKLIELMGGTIEVKSELGAGTQFTVYIDFIRVDKSEYSKTRSADESRQINAFQILRDKRVLLTEDHPLNAEIAMKLLQKAGCKVEWAENGQKSVDMLSASEENYYDLILMDIRMPVLDGLGASRKIRAIDDEYARNIPIIAMTANAYPSDVKNCLDAGMNAHIPKPFEPLKMYETIATVLSEK